MASAARTMTLTLSNVSDAVIDDEAIGTITITNTDPMPKAWMVQFRRTVGSPVVTTPLAHDSRGADAARHHRRRRARRPPASVSSDRTTSASHWSEAGRRVEEPRRWDAASASARGRPRNRLPWRRIGVVKPIRPSEHDNGLDTLSQACERDRR